MMSFKSQIKHLSRTKNEYMTSSMYGPFILLTHVYHKPCRRWRTFMTSQHYTQNNDVVSTRCDS